jgi:hypothetical protein
MALNTFINTLIENIPDKHLPEELDLVLDGGAFNGIYMLGGLLYIKELEQREKIKIKRISGCSIGALMGVCFLLNKMEMSIQLCTECYKCLRKHQDLKKVLNNFKQKISNLITEKDLLVINNRFYITYFDTLKGKQIIKKRYKTVDDLVNYVIKSLYVPYLIERKITDDDGCVDGAFPYMFKSKETNKKRKILFLNLQSIDKFKKIIFIKREKNIYPRLLEGLMDTHNFFEKNQSNNMCSYVNDWNMLDVLLFRLRESIYIIIFYIFRIGLQIDYIIHEKWKNDTFIKKHISVFKNIWRDIMLYLTV